jgi:hypothetical protein
MTISEYLEGVKQRLLTDPLVSSLAIVRERETAIDGHMRARLVLSDGSRLEFSEYVQRKPEGQIEVVTYSYHWSDDEVKLIRRWDNTPHYPALAGFPHHIHVGAEESVEPGGGINIIGVLDYVRRQLS